MDHGRDVLNRRRTCRHVCKVSWLKLKRDQRILFAALAFLLFFLFCFILPRSGQNIARCVDANVTILEADQFLISLDAI